jgi:hypothetical protein
MFAARLPRKVPLSEALLIEFASAMPVARVAAMTREHDTRIWRVLEHHVAVQREKLSFADVRRVGMDETSARKGHAVDAPAIHTFMDQTDTVIAATPPDPGAAGPSASPRRARGYRSKTKMITIIYLIAGSSPTRHPT